MTIPMNNNTFSNSSRERAQHLYNKNVELESKRRKAAQAKIPSDPNTWQQMRENYESILLEDHTFSEQHDIEYALWQLHYKRIEELRAHYSAAQAQTVKDPAPARPGGPTARISKIRSQFKTFLSEATGFYHDLMVKIRGKYGLSSLGCYIQDDPQNDVDMKKGLVSCHRCFIYLGDLARYKGLYGEGDSKTRDFDAASSYYKQAATLWYSSGNPHHQLAILASYSGDELLAVYRYFRSLAVDTPFTTARDNLIIAFEKNRQSYCQLLGDSKSAPNKKPGPARVTGKGRNKGEAWVSLKDRKTEPNLVIEKESSLSETLKAFNIRFVRLNGILFTRTSLETFLEIFSIARSDFLELLSSGEDEMLNFGPDYGECKLLITRLIAIMIFTVYNVKKETEHQSYAEILQRCVVLENAFTAVFDFMGLIVERCIQLKDISVSFLVPGIMIFVEWLACCYDVTVTNEMEEKQVTARSFFWNQFALFLNKILVNQSEKETCVALPEDMELRGFLPLVPGQLTLDFTRNYYSDGNKGKNARVQRIITAGKALTSNKNGHVGQKRLYFDSKSKRFLFGVLPQNKKEVEEEYEQEQEEEEEEEEEEEVIVFKPCVVPDNKQIPSKLLTNNGGASVSCVNENMQLIHPETPKGFMENSFSNLNISGMPSSIDDSETMIPSKFDSVMTTTTATGFDSSIFPSKTKPIKSPVSRPIRHYGPPPGFNTPPIKYMDEGPLFGVNFRNGNGNDDYSWLDGYQLSYSGYSVVNDGIGRCLPQPNKLLNTRKMSGLDMETFPFPGKQVSSTGYQIPGEGVNHYQEPIQQQQVNKGQSFWEGSFFV